MSIVDRQRLKRIYPFFKSRPQSSTLGETIPSSSPAVFIVATGSDFVNDVTTSGSFVIGSTLFESRNFTKTLQTSASFNTVPVTGSVIYSTSLGDYEILDMHATIIGANIGGFRRSTSYFGAQRLAGSGSVITTAFARTEVPVTAFYRSFNEPTLWTENIRYWDSGGGTSTVQVEVTGTGIVDWSADIVTRRARTFATSLSSTFGEAPLIWQSHLLAWYRSTDIVTNGTTVVQMTDKSGQGRHLGNDVLASSPTLELSTAAMSNFNTVVFNGSTQFLTGTMWNLALATGVGYTIFAAYVPVGYTGTEAIWDTSNVAGVTNQYCEHGFSSNGIRYGASPVMTFANPTAGVGTYDTIQIVTGSWAHSEVFFKGVSVATTTSTPAVANPSYLRVGSLFQNVWYFNVKLAELIIFSGTLPTAGRLSIESYLASRYSL